MAIEEGRHVYGGSPHDLPALPRRVRKNIPTLAELVEASDMVSTDDGGLMPARLAGREAGWGTDEDRDSSKALELSTLVARLDALTATYVDPATSDMDVVVWADEVTATWARIRQITRSEGGK